MLFPFDLDFSGSSKKSNLIDEQREAEFQEHLKTWTANGRQIPVAGQNVVVALSAIGNGFPHSMREATVLQVLPAAVKVAEKALFTGKFIEHWIHPALVVAVIPDQDPDDEVKAVVPQDPKVTERIVKDVQEAFIRDQTDLHGVSRLDIMSQNDRQDNASGYKWEGK